MVNQSKYQKFEMDTVSRKQIHGADYNPRVISEDARKRLRQDAGETWTCPAVGLE